MWCKPYPLFQFYLFQEALFQEAQDCTRPSSPESLHLPGRAAEFSPVQGLTPSRPSQEADALRTLPRPGTERRFSVRVEGWLGAANSQPCGVRSEPATCCVILGDLPGRGCQPPGH